MFGLDDLVAVVRLTIYGQAWAGGMRQWWQAGRRGVLIRFVAMTAWFATFYIVDNDRGSLLPMLAVVAAIVTVRDYRTALISDSDDLLARERWATVRLAWRDITRFRVVDGAVFGHTILAYQRDGTSERLMNFPVSSQRRADEVVALLEREHTHQRELLQGSD